MPVMPGRPSSHDRNHEGATVARKFCWRPEGFELPTLGLEGRRQLSRACHGMYVTVRSHAILPPTDPDALHRVAGSFRRGNRRETGGEGAACHTRRPPRTLAA